MSSFIIKLIAIITMTMDHYGDSIVGNFTFLQVFGRMAFPLFCFQLVVGYSKTKNVWKYIFRMIVFAALSAVPHYLFLKASHFEFASNVMFTLALGLLAMYIYDMKIEKKYGDLLKIVSVAAICAISIIAKCEYEAWGVLLILFIHIFCPFKDEMNFFGEKIRIGKVANRALFLTGAFIFSFVRYIYLWNATSVFNISLLVIATFITSIIMLLFNGKKGPRLKYFFYIYYPAQFIILVLLHAVK